LVSQLRAQPAGWQIGWKLFCTLRPTYLRTKGLIDCPLSRGSVQICPRLPPLFLHVRLFRPFRYRTQLEALPWPFRTSVIWQGSCELLFWWGSNQEGCLDSHWLPLGTLLGQGLRKYDALLSIHLGLHGDLDLWRSSHLWFACVSDICVLEIWGHLVLSPSF